MTIPKHDAIRIPALKLLKKQGTMELKDFEIPLAKHFNLSDDEIAKEYDSGNAKIFYDRISWALSYMNMAGLLQKPKRGIYQISSTGIEQLKNPESIDIYINEQLATRVSGKKQHSEETEEVKNLTPQEELYDSSEKIRIATFEEIIDVILSKEPKEFENLVVMLLKKMGYGGEIENSGEVTQYSNDKGIDGIIKEDVLGLGRIHIQAKRYARINTIGREEIQKFVGALAGAKSSKGIFITTSTYTKNAIDFVNNLSGSTTLVLINGRMLAEYIYDYGLGMQVEQTIEIKKLDSDFWDGMRDEI